MAKENPCCGEYTSSGLHLCSEQSVVPYSGTLDKVEDQKIYHSCETSNGSRGILKACINRLYASVGATRRCPDEQPHLDLSSPRALGVTITSPCPRLPEAFDRNTMISPPPDADIEAASPHPDADIEAASAAGTRGDLPRMQNSSSPVHAALVHDTIVAQQVCRHYGGRPGIAHQGYLE